MATNKETCRCGSGKPVVMRGYDKNGNVTMTRCADCEPRTADRRSVSAATSRTPRAKK